jgi:hypothetical protein
VVPASCEIHGRFADVTCALFLPPVASVTPRSRHCPGT